MAQFTIRVDSAKSGFFDRPAVANAIAKGSRRNLSRWGGYLRKVAQNSIKSAPKAKKKLVELNGTMVRPSSRKGQPPYSQTGLLKKFLFYSWDSQNKSVVVGPARLGHTRNPTSPATLEYGGRVTILTYEAARWRSRRVDGVLKREFGRGGPAQKRTLTIAHRPYMWPAYERTKQRLPEIWQDSIR